MVLNAITVLIVSARPGSSDFIFVNNRSVPFSLGSRATRPLY